MSGEWAPGQWRAGSRGHGVEDYVYQGFDIRQVAFEVFLFHPIVVEVGMAGLGHAKGGADEWIVELLGQLQGGAPTVGALGVGQPVTLAVGFQRLAGSSPQLFRSLYRVAGSDVPAWRRQAAFAPVVHVYLRWVLVSPSVMKFEGWNTRIIRQHNFRVNRVGCSPAPSM